MLAVGILGFPFIGFLQESSVSSAVADELPAVYEQTSAESDYLLGNYTVIDATALAALPEAAQAEVAAIQERETQGALGKMAMFPAFILVVYIGLILYFKSKGGYKPKVIGEAAH